MIGNSNYILIPAFARTELDLTGNELLLYSLIYGFSQDGQSGFTGSIGYMSEWTGASRRTVQRTLRDLVDRGLLAREELTLGPNVVPKYTTLFDNGQNDTGGVKMTRGVSKCPEGGVKMTPNNIYIYNNNNNNIYIPELSEVREYILENGYSVDPSYFHSYYSAKGWMLGRNPMTDWRAAVDSWESIQIKSEVQYGL